MPASAAMSSRLVAAKPPRANASVAAVRICSRRCTRGMRRDGSCLSVTTTVLSLLVYLRVYLSTYITSSKEARVAAAVAAQLPELAPGEASPGSSLDGHPQLVVGGGERLLDLVPGSGCGEDEAQVAVPVRERANRLAGGDRD